MNSRKLIFFDIDGTLVDSTTHKVPDSTRDTLQRLKEAGHILCISTGRSLISLMEGDFHKLIDWDIYLCNNGQAIYDHEQKNIHLVPIPPHAVEACIAKADELNSPLFIIGEINRLTREADENVITSANFFNEVIPPVIPYDGSPVIMMIAYGPFGYDYKDYQDIEDLTFIPGQSNYSDVVLKGHNKWLGIQFVLKHFDIKEYIAIGDSLNDYDMIKNATIGIAMGNSCEPIKEIADFITEDVLHDGILHAMTKYKLI